MKGRRRNGILLHPTSLPGPAGIGCLGIECLQFIDTLCEAAQSLWQVLPLGPAAYGNSPYSCYSAFAGNPLLIDLRPLAAEGDLDETGMPDAFPDERVDYALVHSIKSEALKRAGERFLARTGGDTSRKEEFWHFCRTTPWLHDYAVFMAAKGAFGGKSWDQWPEGMSRHSSDSNGYAHELGPAVELQKYLQWQFFRQWKKIRTYANSRGIEIIGDIPIFVAYDSADVWAHPEIFHLDRGGRPLVVAGVPPDYFSKTGQLWGNPLYNWDIMAFHGFDWWIQRMKSALELYDWVRMDHFRGFEAYWEVAATEKTAVNGRWVKGPGQALFNALLDALGPLPIIAEDLGVITPDVEALRDKFSFPGMKILQFAFGSGPENPYLPHNIERHSVIYTGTHDNDTSVGWFSALSFEERQHILEYLNTDGNDIAWDLIRAACASVADVAIIPLQDILSLGRDARMNTPGAPDGNWSWRFRHGEITDGTVKRLFALTQLYGRIP